MLHRFLAAQWSIHLVSGAIPVLISLALTTRPAAAEAPAPVPVAAADYVVRQGDSGEIIVRSGADGAVAASGTDAAKVIQAAIDRLPITGGRVYIAAGSYELTRTIKIEDKHGGIYVKQGNHVIIAQCICSGHDHVAVRNQGQQFGIHVAEGGRNVVVEGNITHTNGKQGILLESKDAEAAK